MLEEYLKSRLKEKDAWDIYYCVRNFPGGVDALIQEFNQYLDKVTAYRDQYGI